MNMIAIPNGEVLEIDGVLRTHEQIRAAFACCRQLELAYELASEDNGGSGAVRWENVDLAREQAALAISHEEQSSLTAAAELCNGYVTAKPLAPIAPPVAAFEFKRADDTEGGTPD